SRFAHLCRKRPRCSILTPALVTLPSMSLTRDLPIRSVGSPPTSAVHPPASQHGVFISFASLYLGCASSARPLPRGFTGHVAHPIASAKAGCSSHSLHSAM